MNIKKSLLATLLTFVAGATVCSMPCNSFGQTNLEHEILRSNSKKHLISAVPGHVLLDFIDTIQQFKTKSKPELSREAKQVLSKTIQDIQQQVNRIPPHGGIAFGNIDVEKVYPDFYKEYFADYLAKRKTITQSTLSIFDKSDKLGALEADMRDRFKRFLAKAKIIQNESEQFTLIFATIENLKKNSELKGIEQAYYISLLGRFGPVSVVRKSSINGQLKLTGKEWQELSKALNKSNREIDKNLIQMKRSAIQSILNELRPSQKKMIESTIGMPIGNLSQMYDRAYISTMTRLLRQEMKEERLDHYETPNVTIKSKSLIKEATELYRPGKTPPHQKKQLIELDATWQFPVGKELNLKPQTSKLFVHFQGRVTVPLLNLPLRTGIIKHYLDQTSYELLPQQQRQLNNIYKQWEKEIAKATNLRGLVKINNDAIAKMARSLLPEQRAIVNQFVIAKDLTFYLTRADVGFDLKISETQRNRIIATAKRQADSLEKNYELLKQKAYNSFLSGFPEQKRIELEKIIGIKVEEAFKILAKHKSLERIQDELKFQAPVLK